MANHEPADFSLALGGPLYQLYLRSGLLRPPLELLHRRIMACVLVTWLPPAILAAVGGNFLGGVSLPFLYDFETHARFLIELPLLIAAELVVNLRLREVVGQFRDRDLIPREDRRSFEAIIAGAVRLRNSVTVELVLLLFAFVVGFWLWHRHGRLHIATWYAAKADDAMSLTLAGYWYALVSLAIGRFLLLRWYFRLFIWYLFLFRVSRLPLQLNPLHADRAGGLGFVSLSVDAFAPVLVAQSALLAGLIANQIWYEGASLLDFKLTIAGFVVFLMLTVLVPLGFFAVQMARARRAALREYGLLSARYADAFRQKWLHGPAPRDDELLGSSDIQSLADLANGYTVVRETGLLPFGRILVLRLAILIALPLLPLALTMFSFEVMVERLIKLIL